MERKHFLKISGFTTGSVLFGSSLTAFLASCNKVGMNMGGGNMGGAMSGTTVTVIEGSFIRLLPIPNIVGANASLIAQSTSANINGSNINVLGYQLNNILGPTIKVSSGSSVNLALHNKLSEPTNIHWHGLKIPSNMDGYPTDIAGVNNSLNYQFTVNQ